MSLTRDVEFVKLPLKISWNGQYPSWRVLRLVGRELSRNERVLHGREGLFERSRSLIDMWLDRSGKELRSQD